MRIPHGPATNWLVGLNVAIYVALWMFGVSNAAAYHYGFMPAVMNEAVQSGDLVQLAWGALLLPLTAAFQHVGLSHVALNSMLLLFTGRFVEFALGTRQFLILYFVSLYAAAYAEFAFNPGSLTPVIGASGAGSGVIAAYMLLYAEKRSRSWGPISPFWARRIALFLLWTVLNLGLGQFFLADGAQVAIISHIGGFTAGLMLTRPLLDVRYGGDKSG